MGMGRGTCRLAAAGYKNGQDMAVLAGLLPMLLGYSAAAIVAQGLRIAACNYSYMFVYIKVCKA